MQRYKVLYDNEPLTATHFIYQLLCQQAVIVVYKWVLE